MAPIRVVVHGALGKMGQEVIGAVCSADDLLPVGAADARAEAASLTLPDGTGEIPLSRNLADVLAGAQVVVDFTNAEGAGQVIRTALSHKVCVVLGSSGISDSMLAEAETLASEHRTAIFVAPNFALGGVLMTYLARLAARFFDYADLTEMHHEAKIDAPSGTAVAIAQAIAEGRGRPFQAPAPEKETIPGTRGGQHGGVTIHSARMPGRMAHHELVFGALGQTLTIRHDSINRESFMPGVTLAIREVVNSTGLTVGLEEIMGL